MKLGQGHMQIRMFSQAALGVVFCVCLSACAKIQSQTMDVAGGAAIAPLPAGTVRPVARPETATLGSAAGTVSTSRGDLGSTIVSLGSPTESGMWLKTPLVRTPTTGHVTFGGASQKVNLIPIEGAASAGSRMSLAAMQALGVPLTELVEIRVFAD